MPKNVFLYIWLHITAHIRQWNSRCALARNHSYTTYIGRFWDIFWPTIHYVSMSNMIIVSKKLYFLNPPIHPVHCLRYIWMSPKKSQPLPSHRASPSKERRKKKAKIEKACFLVSFSGLNWLKHTVFVYWKLFCFLLYVEYKSVGEAGL